MQRLSEDSLNIQEDFMFQLSKDGIDPRDSKGYNYDYDPLEYSADSDTH